MSVTWRRLITHAGSTLALILGCLSLISGIARPSVALITGPVIILGALAYRSAKKRKLGEVKSTLTRKAVEVAFLLLICILILAQNDVLDPPTQFRICRSLGDHRLFGYLTYAG